MCIRDRLPCTRGATGSKNPQHTCQSQYRMYRGGGWYTEKSAAAATRNGNVITERSVVVGIRCVK